MVSLRPGLQLPTSSTSRRGGYGCGFDLCSDSIRIDEVKAFKRLSTKGGDLEESTQAVDLIGKDVGNRKFESPRCGNGPAPAVTGGAAVPQSDGCTGSEWVGPRHHRGTAVEHYAGIDVSLERRGGCVVDATGRIVREAKVASEPEALVDFFRRLGLPLTRVGLEAGPLSQWLHAGLTGAGFEAVLLETRQVKAALSAMVVKTDRKDARGIAQLLRMGWFRPVHRKSADAQEVRALLVGRKLL